MYVCILHLFINLFIYESYSCKQKREDISVLNTEKKNIYIRNKQRNSCDTTKYGGKHLQKLSKQMKMLEIKIKHIFMSINKNKTVTSERNADSFNLKQKISEKRQFHKCIF